jgi:hypothetical protein
MEGLTTTGSAEFVTPRRGTAVLHNGVELARRAEEVFGVFGVKHGSGESGTAVVRLPRA